MSKPKPVIFDSNRFKDYLFKSNDSYLTYSELKKDTTLVIDEVFDKIENTKTIFKNPITINDVMNAFRVNLDTSFLHPCSRVVDNSKTFNLSSNDDIIKENFFIISDNSILNHILRDDFKYLKNFTSKMKEVSSKLNVILLENDIAISSTNIVKNDLEVLKDIQKTTQLLEDINTSINIEKSMKLNISNLKNQIETMKSSIIVNQRAIDIIKGNTLLDEEYLPVNNKNTFIETRNELNSTLESLIKDSEKAIDNINYLLKKEKTKDVLFENEENYDNNNDNETEINR